jgi:methenyltetrahydrofolate cyclohydrolase
VSGGDRSVTQFLAALSDAGPAPGGGAAAALAVALAAALGAMAAGLSRRYCEQAPDIERECVELRDAALSRGDEDAEVYADVVSARRSLDRADTVEHGELGGPGEPDERAHAADGTLDGALSRAADVPLAVAEIGARVAQLAAQLVEEGNPALQGDALTAVLLGKAGTEAAGTLVHINLSERPDDDRHARADAQAADARRSATRARSALRR